MEDLLADERRTLARKLKAAGFTYREVAQKMGISHQRVHQYMKIKRGEKFPSACEKCGKIAKALHCHHTDYETNAFQVLCPSCHRKAHSEERIIFVSARFLPNEAELINAEIKASGLKKSEWIRQRLLSGIVQR